MDALVMVVPGLVIVTLPVVYQEPGKVLVVQETVTKTVDMTLEAELSTVGSGGGSGPVFVLVTVVAGLVTVVDPTVTMTEVTTILEVPAARLKRASGGAAPAGDVDEGDAPADRMVLLRTWPGMSRLELSESGIDTIAYTVRAMATQRTKIWTRMYGRRRARGLYDRASGVARPFSKTSSSSRTAWALYAYALIEGATSCFMSTGPADRGAEPCPGVCQLERAVARSCSGRRW